MPKFVRGSPYRSFTPFQHCLLFPPICTRRTHAENYRYHPSYVFQHRGCPEQDPLPSERGSCALSEWSVWSECSKTCGDGIRTRVRYPLYPIAQRSLCASRQQKQSQSCYDVACPGDCTLSAWSGWSSCRYTRCRVGLGRACLSQACEPFLSYQQPTLADKT